MPPVKGETIRLFGRAGCQPCRLMKAALEGAGLPVEYIDVEQVPEAADHVRQLGYGGVPVVEHAEGSWQGPLAEKVRELVASRVSVALDSPAA